MKEPSFPHERSPIVLLIDRLKVCGRMGQGQVEHGGTATLLFLNEMFAHVDRP